MTADLSTPDTYGASAPASLPHAERMVVLRPSGQLATDDGYGVAFPSWDAFMGAGVAPLGFYLDGWTLTAQDSLAEKVRGSIWWDRPVVVASGGDSTPPLADAAGTYAQARTMSERALAVRRSFKRDPATLHFDERVLLFLYLRDTMELQPLCDRRSAQLYRYPMVEALARDGDDAARCLATLTRRRLLEPALLIDRTRHCRACASAHLHYLDVCPHCSSIHIGKASSLHCFSCGHVGPESAFHDDGALVCPKCSAALRHIGVDYDRPLTQYACGSCHHVFMETSVIARCLDCATTAEPDALDMREVATLRLAPQGRAALRAGQIQESFAALDTANYVEPPYFRRLLDWTLATHVRHKEMRFALILVEFQNATELIEQQGAARVFLMLDEFARRLHELLRTSDITTRTQEERLWLLLPFSSPEGLAARLEKALISQDIASDGSALRARVRYLEVPKDLRSGDSAAQLMDRLQAGD
jgi:GGDEF domain-containing protein